MDGTGENGIRIDEAARPLAGAVAAAPDLVLYPPRSAAGLDPLQPARFAERLEAFRRHHRSLDDRRGRGGLFVLDLEELRRRFANRWPLAREKACRHVEGTIARRLGRNDLYLALPAERYALFLTDLERAAAERLARRIAAEITERLCGMLPGGVACRVRGTTVDLAANLEGVTSVQAIEALLTVAAAAPEHGAEAATLALAAAVEARYAPVLNVTKRLISTYALRAVPRAAAVGTAGTTTTAPPMAHPAVVLAAMAAVAPVDEQMAALDRWAVATAGGLLRAEHFRAALLIPLHYATLASMAHRQPLMLACRKLPAAARRRLLIELVGLPSTLPQARLRELVSYLRPFTVGIVLRLDRAVLDGGQAGARPMGQAVEAQLEGTGIAGLSVHLGDPPMAGGGGADPLARAVPLAPLDTLARRLGLRALCHVGTDRRLCRAALISGINHLTGEALLPAAPRPGRVVALGRAAMPAGDGRPEA